jgi:hypothetical protein
MDLPTKYYMAVACILFPSTNSWTHTFGPLTKPCVTRHVLQLGPVDVPGWVSLFTV